MAACRKTVLSMVLAAFMIMALAGCAETDPLGPVVNEAGLLYMSPEIPEGEEEIGILYRRVLDFDGFLAEAETLVLILVSSYTTPLDQSATLLLEQLAYEYRGQVACLRVEAEDYPAIAAFCGAGTLPCYATVNEGALQDTTGGLDTVNRGMVVALLADAA